MKEVLGKFLADEELEKEKSLMLGNKRLIEG